MPILWCANSLANSFEGKRRKHGRNATGASIIIIEPLRRSCLIVSGRWSRFSWRSSAGAMPGCFGRRCMKFTFHEFNGATRALRLLLLARGGRCSRCWDTSSRTVAGDHLLKRRSRNRGSLRKISSSFLCRRQPTSAATRGSGAPEIRICYEHAESLCHLLGRPLLFRALLGHWRYVLVTDKLSAAMSIAERLHAVAQEQVDPTLTIWAHNALASTHYFLGDFESAREHAMSGIRIWRSQGSQSHPEDVDTPVVGCLCYKAFAEWHLGDADSCREKLQEAISLAQEMKDEHALTIALGWAMGLAEIEHNPAEVERLCLRDH